MPSSTSRQQAPYPVGTDAPYVHLDIKALAEWAGGRVLNRGLSTQRPSTPSDLFDGNVYFETDTRRWITYDSSLGRWVYMSGKSALQAIGGSWTPGTAYSTVTSLSVPPGRWLVHGKGVVVAQTPSATSPFPTYNVRVADGTNSDVVQVLPAGVTTYTPVAMALLVDNTTTSNLAVLLQANTTNVSGTQAIGNPQLIATPA